MPDGCRLAVPGLTKFFRDPDRYQREEATDGLITEAQYQVESQKLLQQINDRTGT